MRGLIFFIFALVVHIPTVLAKGPDVPELWKIEGKGSALYIIGEGHFSASKAGSLAKFADHWLSVNADSIYLEGHSPWDDFDYLKATCAKPINWTGRLRNSADALVQTIYAPALPDDIFAPSAYIEALPVGLIVWGMPNAYSALVDPRREIAGLIDSWLAGHYQRATPSRTIFLDDRAAELADICSSESPEAVLADFYEYKADGYAAHRSAIRSDRVEAMRIAQRKEVLRAAACAIQAVPCDVATIARTSWLSGNRDPEFIPLSLQRWILDARNERWTVKFDAAFSKEPRLIYSVMGMAHLPSFRHFARIDKGIVDRLNMAGYRISPVTAYMEVWEAILTPTFFSSRKTSD